MAGTTASVKPVYAALEIVAGQAASFRFTLLDGLGTPEDITGATITFTARAKLGSKVKMSKTLSISGGPQGICDLNITAGDWTGIDGLRTDGVSEWRYAVKWEDTDRVYFEGPILIEPTAAA